MPRRGIVTLLVLLAAATLAASTPSAAVGSGRRQPDVRLVAAPARTVTYDGIGAVVSAPDPTLPPPRVSFAALLRILRGSAFAQTVSSSAAPTTVSLVTYENIFGQIDPGRPDTPSVPRQRAWFVEYRGVPGFRSLPVSLPGRPPRRAPQATCTAYVAISAATGSDLDGFSICH